MKKFSISFLVAVFLFLVSFSPAHAEENFFQKFTHQLQSGFQRVYLMLPGDKPGDVVLQQTVDAAKNIKTAQTKASASVDFLQADQNLANVKVNIEGPVEINSIYDPQSYKQDLKVSGEATMQGTSMKASADVKLTGSLVYFRLNELPVIPFFNFDELKGKWLKSEVKARKADAQLTQAQQDQFMQAYTKLFQSSKLSSAQKTTKNDHNVYVLDINIPKAALAEYLDTVNKIQTSNTDVVQTDEMKKDFSKVLDNIGDLKVTLWIDQSSFFVRHIEMPISYIPEKQANPGMAGTPLSALSQADKVNVLVTVDMDQFNAPITFEEPKDAEDAQQAFQKMMGGTTGVKPPVDLQPQTPTPTTPAELPGLTPAQKALLEKYRNMKNGQ